MDFLIAHATALHFDLKYKRKSSEFWIDPVEQVKVNIEDVMADDWELDSTNFAPITAYAIIKKDGTLPVLEMDFEKAKEILKEENSAFLVKLVDERVLEESDNEFCF